MKNIIGMLILLGSMGAAVADEFPATIDGYLDEQTTHVTLKDSVSKCNLLGKLFRNQEGFFIVIIDRRICLNDSGIGFDMQTIHAHASIGQMPHMANCAGESGCLRGLPENSIVKVQFYPNSEN